MPAISPLRLGVNVDHVATVRNARGGIHPDPVEAAKIAIAAGADYLVVGRPITAAPDPRAVATAIVADIAKAAA